MAHYIHLIFRGAATELSTPRVGIVCYTAVFSVVTQRSGEERCVSDDTKNGCVANWSRDS